MRSYPFRISASTCPIALPRYVPPRDWPGPARRATPFHDVPERSIRNLHHRQNHVYLATPTPRRVTRKRSADSAPLVRGTFQIGTTPSPRELSTAGRSPRLCVLSGREVALLFQVIPKIKHPKILLLQFNLSQLHLSSYSAICTYQAMAANRSRT